MNLSLSGSRANERFIILNYASKKKKIKNIIYSLDVFLAGKIANTKSFEKIYNIGNFFTPLGIYMDFKHPRFIRCALTYSTKEKCVGIKKDVEELTSWTDERVGRFRGLGGLENWKEIPDELATQILTAKEFNPPKKIDIEKNKARIQEYLINLIQKNPSTNFYFIIPPYPRLRFAINVSEREKTEWYDNKDTDLLFFYYKPLIEWFIKETSKYPNVKIYGFDDLDYADNIANYMDIVHYNIDMNSMQLDAIKNNTHILTPENMDKYFEIMEEKIRNYDLEPFIKIAKEILDKN